MRLPSGENDGAVAVFLPVVICSSPCPLVWTRKSWAAVAPCGVAEKTIQSGPEAAAAAWVARTHSATTPPASAGLNPPERCMPRRTI